MMGRNRDDRAADRLRREAADYVAGALTGEHLTRFEEAMAGDQGLRGMVDRLEALWERLPDRAAPGTPAPLWPRVEARLHRGERLVPLAVPVPRWRMAASFAAGVIVGIAAWVLATGGPADTSAAEEELFAHESVFETLDPIPPYSVGGLYFTALPVEPDDQEEPR